MSRPTLHPELRRAYRFFPSIPLHNRTLLAALVLLQRLAPARNRIVAGIRIEQKPLGAAAVRIYRPQDGGCGAALLWIHGGGYVIGNAAISDRECIKLVQALNVTVVSVDYRLAPRHPFPAPLDDCFSTWQWMQEAADDLGIDPARIATVGQSAGGGLAAALTQRIADHGGIQPAAQVLMYPMLDDRTAVDATLDAGGHRLWSNRNNHGGWSCYLGHAPGLTQVPAYAVPARRDALAGLPPAWIGVGDLDLFHLENLAYADRLRHAGVPCELHVTAQAPHAFDIIAPAAAVSQAFIGAYHDFLRRHLAPGRDPQRQVAE